MTREGSVTAPLCHIQNFNYIYTMIITYLSPLVVSWWFTHFEPTQNALDKLILPDWLHTALGCWKCLSFWSALVYSQSITVACATSLTAVCLNKLIYNS